MCKIHVNIIFPKKWYTLVVNACGQLFLQRCSQLNPSIIKRPWWLRGLTFQYIDHNIICCLGSYPLWKILMWKSLSVCLHYVNGFLYSVGIPVPFISKLITSIEMHNTINPLQKPSFVILCFYIVSSLDSGVGGVWMGVKKSTIYPG